MTTIVHTECDLCHARFRIDDDNLGKKVKCRKCGASFIAGLAVEEKQPTRPRWTETAVIAAESKPKPHPHACPDCGCHTMPVVVQARQPLHLWIAQRALEVMGGFIMAVGIAVTIYSVISLFFLGSDLLVGPFAVLMGIGSGFGIVVSGSISIVFAFLARVPTDTHAICPSCKWKGKRLA